MLIKEYKVTLPLTVEEYQVGQLYTVAEASKNETGGGEGIVVLANEPFENHPLLNGLYSQGQYTHKVYRIRSKLPAILRYLIPSGPLELHEESWNAYPFIRTIITSPKHQKDFFIIIDSIHLSDRGQQENAHGLTHEKLEVREVALIDVVNDQVNDTPFDEATGEMIFERFGRGPFTGNWRETINPVMTCYKLVSVEFKFFGLQKKVESFIHRYERKLFTKFHRQVVCGMDKWLGMTMADIRIYEEETTRELNRQILEKNLRGSFNNDLKP